MKKQQKVVAYLFFLCYIVIITATILGYQKDYFNNIIANNQGLPMMNLIPFKTLIEEGQDCLNGNMNFNHWINYLISNLLLFVPLGLFLPLLYAETRKFNTFLFLCSIIILIIESVQLVLRCGCFNIDDFILGLLGASLGYLIFNSTWIQLKLTNKMD